MAMLNESNLLAMKAKAAKFRTHHVGTKLNEAEFALLGGSQFPDIELGNEAG